MPQTKTKPARPAKAEQEIITQHELAACFEAHRLCNTLQFLVRKKLDAGAQVEPGRYGARTSATETPEPSILFDETDAMGVCISVNRSVDEILGDYR